MKLTDFPIHRKNPFLKELFIKEATKISKIQDTDLKITDSQGHVKGKVVYAKEHNIDRTPFVKMFEFDFLNKIGKSGIVVFVYICKHAVRYGNDKVVILFDEIISYTDYTSEAPIYKGLAALVQENVIARTSSTNYYYINPAVFYKGERWHLNNK